jgi:tetratricopeptide (TPR) repeat protein
MQQPPVDWLTPILMLAAGLVIGIIVAVIVARKGRTSSAADVTDEAVEELSDLQLELRDLEAKREDLLLQLREMEDTAAKRDPAQLATERYVVELETAECLRDIDRLTGRMNAPALKRAGAKAGIEPASETSGPPGGVKGFVWGVASAAAIGALVIFVSNSASHRGEGGSVTGGPQMGGRPMQSQPANDPELEQAIALVNSQPDNVQARVDLAYQYLLREQFMNVFEQTQLVLERDPNQPRALTYQSLVRLAMGQGDMATEMLKRAIEIDPDFLDSRVYLALTYAQTGHFDDAMAEMAEAKTRHPDESARLDEVIAELEMRRSSGATPSEPTGPDPHASLLPPPPAADGSAPAAPAAAPAAGPGSVTGMIVLADGVTVQRGAPVFVIVRQSGASGGPPSAVSRMSAGTFPMPFTVSAANSMMGDALPEKMRIEVRVDLDGNAMTRDQGAPEGVLDDVASGTSGVTITLRP